MGSLGKESYLNCAESMKSWVTFSALALNLLFYCFELSSLWKYLQHSFSCKKKAIQCGNVSNETLVTKME